MLKLEFKNFEQTSFWIVDERFTIGSSGKNELVIRHDSLLEKHVEVAVLSDSMIEVTPTPGAQVCVDERPVQSVANVSVGQILTLGEVQLRLFDPSESHRKTPPKIFALQDKETTPVVQWKIKAVGQMSGGLISVVGDTYVGREMGNDIVLPGNHISRRHARLFLHNNQLMVHDLDSSNGTYVNDEKIRESALYLGDRVRFDSFEYLVAVGQTKRPQASSDKTAYRPVITADMLSDYEELDSEISSKSPTPLENAKIKVKEASKKSLEAMQVQAAPPVRKQRMSEHRANPVSQSALAMNEASSQSIAAPKANTAVLGFLLVVFLFALALLLMVLI